MVKCEIGETVCQYMKTVPRRERPMDTRPFWEPKFADGVERCHAVDPASIIPASASPRLEPTKTRMLEGTTPLGLCVSGLGQSKNRGSGECETYPGFYNPLGSHLPNNRPAVTCGAHPPPLCVPTGPLRWYCRSASPPTRQASSRAPKRSWQSPYRFSGTRAETDRRTISPRHEVAVGSRAQSLRKGSHTRTYHNRSSSGRSA
jgi:hypothetical protein